MSDTPKHLPGHGFLGWLGRQVGYVSKAVKTEVTPPTDLLKTPDSQTIYRDCRIEEQPFPQDPNVKLRRTTIDEVIVKGVQNSERKVQNENNRG